VADFITSDLPLPKTNRSFVLVRYCTHHKHISVEIRYYTDLRMMMRMRVREKNVIWKIPVAAQQILPDLRYILTVFYGIQ
jgi:hypothetical protein